MKKLYPILLLLLIIKPAHAKYPADYIYDSIKNHKVFHCFSSQSPNVKIAFDGYRERLYHYPFTTYNRLKLIKWEKLDDNFPLYRNTYAELPKNKPIATLTIMSQGNDIWEATYQNHTGKAVAMDIASFDLTKVQALCSNDLNDSE